MLDLEAIKARANAATKGPWFCNGDIVQLDTDRRAGVSLDQVLCDKRVLAICRFGKYADSNFIAHARDDIPSLIAEVERLSTPPRGYPECTSAIVDAVGEPGGEILIRKMHADEELIGQLLAACKMFVRSMEITFVGGPTDLSPSADFRKSWEAGIAAIAKFTAAP